MTTETIEWIACADRLPDDAETVLLYTPGMHGEEVTVGWRDGDRWLDISGYPLAPPEPTHWSAWPGGPK